MQDTFIHNKKTLFLLSLLLVFFLFSLFFITSQTKKTIYLNAYPNATNFKVNGLTGKTPAVIRLKPGNYTLELSYDKYKSKSEKIKVRPLQKELKIYYVLELLPPEEIGTGGNLNATDQEIKKQNEEYKAKFPFAALLPVQTEAYYISMPSTDGLIPVYIFKSNEAQAKQAVYRWFSDHGVANPTSLNISWRYSQ